MINLWLLSVSLALFAQAQAGAQEDVRPDVGFVPTPPSAVEAMLKLAEPHPGETLYDLGCGDGRIVIAAARRWGVRGLGVDIDPDLIARSREKARAAGVDHLVRFEQANIFETDIKDADIVALYLLTWINVSLRPRLLEQLRPGSRVVAHQFGMDEWPPDAIRHVLHEGERHSVMLWIIPANCTGTWRLSAVGLPPQCDLHFEQLFQHANGRLILEGESRPLLDLSLKGSELAFTVGPKQGESGGGRRFTGEVMGHRMTGRVTRKTDTGPQEAEWSAVREPATMRSLDPRKRGRRPGAFSLKRLFSGAGRLVGLIKR